MTVSSRPLRLTSHYFDFFFYHRTNRTHLRDDLFAIGKLKEGVPGKPFEDDLMLFLGIEAISSVKFFKRLQLGDAVLHSRAYKRVTKRNNYTVAYTHDGDTQYGQIEEFFMVKEDHHSALTCGAVIAQMPKSGKHLCECHELLGCPVNHIAPLYKPKENILDIVNIQEIIDVCVYMKFTDSDIGYAAHFPNHLEKD